MRESELQELSARYGEPLRISALADQTIKPLASSDRIGEVCMVVRRPNGRLLAARKRFYPAGIYRLMTGGIGHHERVFDALLRETFEETGLEVAVRRFLALLSYPPGSFFTAAFLLDELGGVLEALDPREQVEEYLEIGVEDLPELISRLAALPELSHEEIGRSWRSWGLMRIPVHQAVYQALRGEHGG